MAEYHVVRQGLDELGMAELLATYFEQVTVHPYWSTQDAVLQRLGTRLARPNTFALEATCRR